MMTQSVELAGLNGGLSVEPTDTGWAHVFFFNDEERIGLGADMLKHIAGQLLSFLEQRGPGTKSVLSLFELHFSIYGEHVEGKALLKIQDPDAKFVATLEVNAEQQLEWAKNLRPYKT
ncbi:MAG: hypothetical protein ABIQ16_07830 [Polyangiaceae bacterium]